MQCDHELADRKLQKSRGGPLHIGMKRWTNTKKAVHFGQPRADSHIGGSRRRIHVVFDLLAVGDGTDIGFLDDLTVGV